MFDKFIPVAHKVLQSGKVRKLEIYTSAEAQGDKAGYIRTALIIKSFLIIQNVCLKSLKIMIILLLLLCVPTMH